MRSIFLRFCILVLANLAIANTVMAGPREDIRATISNQLAAFSKDDFDTAFEFASPQIQGLFQSSDNFGRMVRQGYPMVWRSQDVRFLELSQKSGGFDQVVRMKDPTGTVHFLRYAMQLVNGEWRINGVEVLKASDFSA